MDRRLFAQKKRQSRRTLARCSLLMGRMGILRSTKHPPFCWPPGPLTSTTFLHPYHTRSSPALRGTPSTQNTLKAAVYFAACPADTVVPGQSTWKNIHSCIIPFAVIPSQTGMAARCNCTSESISSTVSIPFLPVPRAERRMSSPATLFNCLLLLLLLTHPPTTPVLTPLALNFFATLS